jgi:hypothetical protein
MIEQQKGIEVIQARGRYAALKPDTGTLHNGLRFNSLQDFSGLVTHGFLPWNCLPAPISQQENISIILSYFFGVMEYWSVEKPNQ